LIKRPFRLSELALIGAVMNRTALVLELILALSVSLMVGAQFVGLAEANFTPLPELPTPIYIRNDGSVEPSTAPLKRAGNTYTFTGNIDNTIEIQRSNTVVDGNGFTLTKPDVNTGGLMTPIGWLPGIHIVETNDIIITNIAFKGCITGITAENSSNITISHNTIIETITGIVVSSSSYVSIVGNDIILIDRSFASGIIFLPDSPQESVPHHIRIEGNRIVGNSHEVPNRAPQPEQYGIWGGFKDSEMTKNILTNIKGIALYNIGANNRIVSNNFQENYEGILININQYVWFNNFIYGNNFNHNSENVVVAFIRDPPVNYWCYGTVGNYWSDYNGTDADGDGIGDAPYIIETTYIDYERYRNVTVEEGRDNYPSMTPFEISPFNLEPLQPSPASPTPSTEPQTAEQDMTTGAVFTVASIVVFLGLLFYFIKRR